MITIAPTVHAMGDTDLAELGKSFPGISGSTNYNVWRSPPRSARLIVLNPAKRNAFVEIVVGCRAIASAIADDQFKPRVVVNVTPDLAPTITDIFLEKGVDVTDRPLAEVLGAL